MPVIASYVCDEYHLYCVNIEFLVHCGSSTPVQLPENIITQASPAH